MEELSGVLKGAGARALVGAPSWRWRRQTAELGADRGGPGVAQGRAHCFSGSHWLLAGARHSDWCSPPAPGELELRRS